ncbi:BCCT family transporter [Desulfonema ishimotonii]|uniref:BCCT family transporter n=1 Tax=Desulfonema ishimotonii TaxID=45657 RepID=A0A401FZ85_9BACT|nr:BCCT family transporter [Desulfonema ishimotonii]GBC62256.1 BCCT family transporter [Desulfonema ishimotonii]
MKKGDMVNGVSHMGIRKLLGSQLDKRVFFGATVLALPFLILGGLSPTLLDRISNTALGVLTRSWSWLYLISCSAFVLICLGIAVSPLGKIRLGKDDERPEFSFLSWFAMLFSAGMGIGLVFWGGAEPMYHYMSPPTGQGGTPEAARLAFEIFFFHWGLHAWGTYVVVGLSMAYFVFRKGKPAIVSACLSSLLGKRLTDGTGGNLINILAIWATIMGVVTSLGMGALQISSGLAHSTGLPAGPDTAAVIIAVITCLFIISAITGVSKGIRILSLLNVSLMVLLLAFFFFFGPFGYLMRTFGQALADYVTGLMPLSASLVLFDNPEWTRSWTVFYWAWWVAWAPFVGAFIARISRGRTVRQFILVVMIAPPLFSYIFSVGLGGTAVWLDLFQNAPIGEAVKQSIEVALFETLHHLPFYGLLVVFTNLLIASFFITSADSATYVISRFSTGGLETRDPGARLRLIIFWGVVLGSLAVVLIYSGGLKALQTASIVGAFPFLFVMYLLLIAVIRDMIREVRTSETC